MGNSSQKVTAYESAKQSEGRIGGVSFKFASAVAKGRRKTMEDLATCQVGFTGKKYVKDIGWFAVFDGHGGRRVADYCSKNMFSRFMHTDTMKSYQLTVDNITRGLREAYLEMDDEVDSLAPLLITQPPKTCIGKPRDVYVNCEYTGTTATTVVLTKSHIHVAHVGDSRAVFVSDGKVKYETFDHHPDAPEEMKRILEANGSVVNSRIEGNLAVSRAIGDFVYKRDLARKISQQWVIPIPVVETFERTPEDEYLIIASDGLWAVMETDEVIEFINEKTKSKGMSLARCCDELMNECLRNRGSADNVSLVLLNL